MITVFTKKTVRKNNMQRLADYWADCLYRYAPDVVRESIRSNMGELETYVHRGRVCFRRKGEKDGQEK